MLNNDIYFNTLKSSYPSLNNFACTNNALIYNNIGINLSNLDLRFIDKSLYYLKDENDIYNIIKLLSIDANYPTYAQDQQNYLTSLLNKSNLSDDETNYINNFMKDYDDRRRLDNIFHMSELENDFKIRNLIICYAYNEPETVGKKLIKDDIEAKSSQGLGQKKVVALTRTRIPPGGITYTYDENEINNEKTPSAAFISPLLIMIITSILGVLIAIVLK